MFELLYSVYIGSLFADEEKVKIPNYRPFSWGKKRVSNPEFSHMAYDSQSVPVRQWTSESEPSGHQWCNLAAVLG